VLKRLFVDNIRCLSNFELRPAQVSVLVGSNGVGKSTVFDVLSSVQGFLSPAGPAAHEVVPGLSRTRWDTRQTQRVELDVEDADGEMHYSLQITHEPSGRNAIVEQEKLTADGQVLYLAKKGAVELADTDGGSATTTFPVDPRRSFLPILEGERAHPRIAAFKNWVSRMWLFRLKPEFGLFSQREQPISVDGSNFVSWYRVLTQEAPRAVQQVQEDMRELIPGLQAMPVRPSGDMKQLVFECELAGKSFFLLSSELSDGQRVLLMLYTILRATAGRTSLLVFDEPANFIAQGEIQPWLAALREAVTEESRGSLMVMSHHPEVVDYLAADQILQLTRDTNGPTRVRPVGVDRSAGLRASEWLQLEGASVAVQ
jgi:predicted ATPase